jgi:hypothetical protein
MPLRIRPNAEPFSPQARPVRGGPDRPAIKPLLAQSQGGRLLAQELRRYCNGEVRGRSFLVAGHRGSGKTTLVDDALLRFQLEAADGELLMKPLPVYLLGPTLLDDDRGPGRAESGAPPAPPAPAPTLTVSVVNQAPSGVTPPPAEEDDLMHRVLIQVVLALHQAVAKQFVDRFHERARLPDGLTEAQIDELCAIAAQFEIELTEAPPPSRLHEFWQLVDKLQDGVLFDTVAQGRVRHGMRELVALTGVTHAHQRVSGELKEQDDQRSGRSRESEVAIGSDSKAGEILKPLLSVFSGAAVTTASAAHGSTATAIALGVLTTLGAGLFLRMSTSSSHKRERKVDRTFIPDLSIKTLHRLLPSLIERLQDAGLAPVFIVDELDKVDDLERRIYPLIRNLKKLFAERSCTCLLVDRGFYENLVIREDLEQQPSPAAAPPAPDGAKP